MVGLIYAQKLAEIFFEKYYTYVGRTIKNGKRNEVNYEA